MLIPKGSTDQFTNLIVPLFPKQEIVETEHRLEFPSTFLFSDVKTPLVSPPIVILHKNPLLFRQVNFSPGSIINFNDNLDLYRMLDSFDTQYSASFPVTSFELVNIRTKSELGFMLTAIIHQVLILFVLSVVFSFSAISVFLAANAKKSALQYTLGFSSFKRNLIPFITFILLHLYFIYIAVQTIASGTGFILFNIILMTLLIIIDSLLLYRHTKKITHRNVTQLIKGDKL